jgi:hypothetical protein
VAGISKPQVTVDVQAKRVTVEAGSALLVAVDVVQEKSVSSRMADVNVTNWQGNAFGRYTLTVNTDNTNDTLPFACFQVTITSSFGGAPKAMVFCPLLNQVAPSGQQYLANYVPDSTMLATLPHTTTYLPNIGQGVGTLCRVSVSAPSPGFIVSFMPPRDNSYLQPGHHLIVDGPSGTIHVQEDCFDLQTALLPSSYTVPDP